MKEIGVLMHAKKSGFKIHILLKYMENSSRIDMLGHTTSLNKFKYVEIISSISSTTMIRN